MVILLDSPFDRPNLAPAAFAADAPVVSPASRATPGRLRTEGWSAGWGGEVLRVGRRRDGAPVVRRLGVGRGGEPRFRPLRGDPGCGKLAQRAAQVVMQHQAPRAALRLDVGRGGEPLRGVRQRHDAPRDPLDGEEQRGERSRPSCPSWHACGHAPRTVGALRLLARAYARSRRNIRRSFRIGSSPFGVSIILIIAAKRASRMIRRNGSGPISPSPIHWWRSRREPRAPLESFRCKHLSSGRPTARSNWSHTGSIAPATSYPAAWRWALSAQNPTPPRTAAGIASRSALSSSNVDPRAVPAPAVPSISTPTSSGAAARHAA